jgi:hypothetical protein
MALINHRAREIHFKVVYYGPGLGGKTTNLQFLHDRLPPERRGRLISIATDHDRTLFFDFLPIDLGQVNGFTTRFHLYTVPGQVYYNASRKLILKGVDGVVFVGDSQTERMEANVESMQNLYDNMTQHGLDLTRLPFIIQYNKRDLPNAAPVEYMEFLLNNREVQVPSFTSVGHKCEGVFESLNMITRVLLNKFINQNVPQYA